MSNPAATRSGFIAVLLWSSLALLTTLTGELPSLLVLAMGFGSIGAAIWLWDAGTKRGNIALPGGLSHLAPLLSTLGLVLAGRAAPHWVQAVAIGSLLAGAWLSLRASRGPHGQASSSR